MPATIVSPPRTSGLPAARATLDSIVSWSRPTRPTSFSSGCGGFRRCQGGIIIRMVGNLFYVLDVADHVVLIQYEDGAALDPQIFDQRSVSFAKGTAAMVGKHLD